MDFVVGEARLRHRVPLRFDEELDIRVGVGDVGRATGRAGRLLEPLRERLAAGRALQVAG